MVPVLRPRAYVPNHWDGLFSPFLGGLPFPYSDAALTAYLASLGIPILPQTQYMDGYAVTRRGVTRLENREMKRRLGFPVSQPFSAATLSAAAVVDTARPDDCEQLDDR